MAQPPTDNPFLEALGTTGPVRQLEPGYDEFAGLFVPPDAEAGPTKEQAVAAFEQTYGIPAPEVLSEEDVAPAPPRVRKPKFTPLKFGEKLGLFAERVVPESLATAAGRFAEGTGAAEAFDWASAVPEFAQKILRDSEKSLYEAPPDTALYNLAVADLFVKEALAPFTSPLNAASLALSGGAGAATRAAVAGRLTSKTAQMISGGSAVVNAVAAVPAAQAAAEAVEEAYYNPTGANLGAALGYTGMTALGALGFGFDARAAGTRIRPMPVLPEGPFPYTARERAAGRAQMPGRGRGVPESEMPRERVVTDREWANIRERVRMADAAESAERLALPEPRLALPEPRLALPEAPDITPPTNVLPSDGTVQVMEIVDKRTPAEVASAKALAETTRFNNRVKQIIDTFADDGVKLNRNQAREIARITDSREYARTRQTLLDAVRPLKETDVDAKAVRKATVLKGFADLTPELVGVKPEPPVTPKKAGVVAGEVPVLKTGEPAAAPPAMPEFPSLVRPGTPLPITRRALELETRTPIYDSGLIDPDTGKPILVDSELRLVEPRPYGGPRTPEEQANYQQALAERVAFEKRAAALDRVDRMKAGDAVMVSLPDAPAPVPAMYVGKAMQGNSVVTTATGGKIAVPNTAIYRAPEVAVEPVVPRFAKGPAYVGEAMQGKVVSVPEQPVATTAKPAKPKFVPAAAETQPAKPKFVPEQPAAPTPKPVREPIKAEDIAERRAEINERIAYLDELKQTREITPEEHKARVAEARTELAAVTRGAKVKESAATKTPEERAAGRAAVKEEVSAEKGKSRRRTAEEWADDVLKARAGRVSANPFLDPEWLAANTIKGSFIIARGVTKFADWSAEMIREQSAAIRPHLRKLWEYIQTRNMVDEVNDLRMRMGTSNPTAVSATERGYTHDTVINLERLRRDPELVAKLEASIRKTYPYLKLGNDPIGVLTKHVKDNLLFLYDRVPEAVREQTKRWYDGARKITLEWSERYDLPRDQVSGVLAALSPQKDWFQNIALAERIIDTVTNPPNGGRMTAQMDEILSGWVMRTKEKYKQKALSDKTRELISNMQIRLRNTPLEDLSTIEQAVWVRAYSEAHLPKSYNTYSPDGEPLALATNEDGSPKSLAWSGFNNEISSAISILRDGSRENISQRLGDQHKVRNFYNNILLPNDPRYGDVTIDTHAVAAGTLKPLSGKDIEVKQNFGSAGRSSVHGVNGTYAIFADAYRQAAAERGVLPREMQSITWEAIRGLFPAKLKRGANVIEELAEGDIDEGAVDKGLKTKISTIWNDYAKGKQPLDQTRKLIESAAGGIRIPEWLGSNRGVPEGQRAPRNIGELPRVSPVRIPADVRSGIGGYPSPKAPGRVVPEEYPGDLTLQGSMRGMREQYLTGARRGAINYALLNALGQTAFGAVGGYAYGYNKDPEAPVLDRVINGLGFALFGGLVANPRIRNAIARGVYNAQIPNKYLRFGAKRATAGNDNTVVFLGSALKELYPVLQMEPRLAASLKERPLRALQIMGEYRYRATPTDWAMANRALMEPGLFGYIGDPRLRAAALIARSSIDDFSLDLIGYGVIRPGSDLESLIDQNRGRYLTRTYRVFTDPDFQIDPAKQSRAIAEYVAQMQLAGSTKSLAELRQEGLETVLHQIARATGGAFAPNARSFAMGQGITRVDGSILKPRKQLSNAWREMLGEIKDPVYAATITIDRQADIIAATLTQSMMRDVGLRSGLFSTSGSDVHSVPLFPSKGQPVYGDPYGPLRGLYTTREVADGLQTLRSYQSQGALWRGLQLTTGKVKIGLTVFNPVSYAPNLIGAALNPIVQGHGITLVRRSGVLRDAYSLVFDNPFPSNRRLIESDIPMLIREGILGQNVGLNDLVETAELSGATDFGRSMVTWLPKPLARMAKAVGGGALRAYGVSEELPRIIGFYSEVERYSEALFGKPRNRLTPNEQAVVYDRAIKVSKMVYPNAAEVPEIIKKLSTAGVLQTFVSFLWETFRTSYNTVRVAKMDIDEAYQTGNPRLGKAAAMRLSAMVGIVGGGYLLGQAFNQSRGVSGEQGEAIRRRLVRRWDRTGQLVITDFNEDELAYANQSYLLPQANLTAAIEAGLSGDTVDQAALRFTKELGGMFIGEGNIVLNAAYEAARNQNAYGRAITPRDGGAYFDVSGIESPERQEAATFTQNIVARAAYVLRKLAPGFVNESYRAYKAANEEMGPDGQVYTLGDTGQRLMGVRVTRVNIPLQLKYDAEELKGRLLDATKELGKARNRPDATPDKIDAAYQMSEQSRKIVFRDIVQYLRDGETLNRKKEEMIDNLKGMNPELLIGAIIGVYIPGEKEVKVTARDVYLKLQQLEPGKRDAELARIAATDPLLARRVVPYLREDLRGRTQMEKLILSLDAEDGSRAQMIALIAASQPNEAAKDVMYRHLLERGLATGITGAWLQGEKKDNVWANARAMLEGNRVLPQPSIDLTPATEPGKTMKAPQQPQFVPNSPATPQKRPKFVPVNPSSSDQRPQFVPNSPATPQKRPKFVPVNPSSSDQKTSFKEGRLYKDPTTGTIRMYRNGQFV